MAGPVDYLTLADSGLQPKAARPKKVVIVGAGMAGLVAAYELLRAGHDPLILEAQQRVGGRVYTMRDPFASGLYAEAGAMRIPKAHTLTIAYVEKFGLSLSPFNMNRYGTTIAARRRWPGGNVRSNVRGGGLKLEQHRRLGGCGNDLEA